MEDLDKKIVGYEDNADNKNPIKKIGIIGMGRIGEALLTQILKQIKDFPQLENLFIYSRPNTTDEDRVDGVITQLAPSFHDITMANFVKHLQDLSDLSKECDTVVITLGKREGGGKQREDLTGQYFKDIINIMGGIGDNNPTIFMVTNPVTPNCLIAHLYSQNEHPKIFGFTRLDHLRAKYILNSWLQFQKKDFEETDLYVLGPHGKGLIVTGIKINGSNRIYTNHGLKDYLGTDFKHSLEELSQDTVDYGERTYHSTGPEGTPSVFATEILNSLKNMSNSDRKTRDTVAMPVDLTKIYGKGLIPITPIYLSIPVIYREGIPTLDSDFKIESIPKKYRKDLLKTLMAEEGRIKEYLMIHKNGFKKAMQHFNL